MCVQRLLYLKCAKGKKWVNCVKRFSIRACVIACLIFAVMAVSLLPVLAGVTPVAAASPAGFPMYAWGSNGAGQLGLGDLTNRTTPHRVGTATNWVSVATAAGGSFAINADGELFGWGAAWTAPQMGQGGPGAGTGNITTPTQIGAASNWVAVSARSNNVLALNSAGEIFRWGAASVPLPEQNTPTQVGTGTSWAYIAAGNTSGYAINTDGELFSWGANGSGQLGQGDSTSRSIPTQVGSRTDWESVSAGANFVVARTAAGELFSWGTGTSGQLGHGNSSSLNTPTRIGTANNWVDARTTNSAASAINADGELFTWGATTGGQLGRAVSGASPADSPGRAGTASDWVTIMGGNGFFFALNEDGSLYAWGANGSGQLGLGDTVSRSVPTFMLQTSAFSTISRGGGGQAIMLMRIVPIEYTLPMEKLLQKPEGTAVPSKSFTFTFERISFNDNTANAGMLPVIPDRTIQINSLGLSTTAGGVTTTIGATDALEDVEFDRPGVFSFFVREVTGSSGTLAPSSMAYSLAEYEMRVYVDVDTSGAVDELYVSEIRIIPRIIDNDSQAVGVATDDLVFTNVYTPDQSSSTSTTRTVRVDFFEGSVATPRVTHNYIHDLSVGTTITLDMITTPTGFPRVNFYPGVLYDIDVAVTAEGETVVRVVFHERIVPPPPPPPPPPPTQPPADDEVYVAGNADGEQAQEEDGPTSIEATAAGDGPKAGPQTGDWSNPALHLLHMIAAMVLVAVVLYRLTCSSEMIARRRTG